jgi:hypothetical protein
MRCTLMKNDRSFPAILRIWTVRLTSIHLMHRMSAHVCQKRHVRMKIDVALMSSNSGGCMNLQHRRSHRSRSHTTKKSSEQEVPPTHTAPSRSSGVPARNVWHYC